MQVSCRRLGAAVNKRARARCSSEPPHMEALAECDIALAVTEAVAREKVIDLHTHLFPPSHGALMLWGCDALLTYHYLVAEYFISALDPPSPDAFYR